MKPARIEVNIEELVLIGFEARNRHRIGEAVQQELTRSFALCGVPQSLALASGAALLDRGAFWIADGSNPRTIAIQVANAVHQEPLR